FSARRGVYGSWRVDPDSVVTVHRPVSALSNGSAPPGGSPSYNASSNGSSEGTRPFRDPLRFLARAGGLLGLDGATLGHLIRELTHTLSADARLDHTALTAAR
ncbi:IucA/IucC family siderophore biosynthesis protein, partial [Streptomyces sp. SID8455]|nr:IucA/IucC family siderophore biosynthesis protein [Streptomyces sp. SID8455]